MLSIRSVEEKLIMPKTKDVKPASGLPLSTGSLTIEQVDLVLAHLPVDVSFVDENDIRYFAVRDSARAYRGCLEVSQDVTGIRALKAQKRLLDWK
jgi:DUF438 domain-containing protein